MLQPPETNARLQQQIRLFLGLCLVGSATEHGIHNDVSYTIEAVPPECADVSPSECPQHKGLTVALQAVGTYEDVCTLVSSRDACA